MYYKLRNDIIYRYYETFAYLTDNNDFGYYQVYPNNIREKIVSQSGAVFLKVLEKIPLDIETIVERIKSIFCDVESEILKKDAVEFYNELASTGFLDYGDTEEQCIENEKICFFATEQSNDCEEEQKKIYTQEFFDNTYNNRPQLRSALIEITTQCNERCIHCYIPHEYKVELMESRMIYDLLQQIRDMNVLNITITGGEPMLHKEFIGLLKKCNELNFSVNVLSNLTLLNDEIIDEMKNNRLLCVQTSLYSMKSEIHEEITGYHGSQLKTVSSIQKLIENNIPVQINCPILKNNIYDYKSVMLWAKSKGIMAYSDFAVFAQYNNCRSNLKCRLSHEEVEKITLDKVQNDEDYRNKIENDVKRKENDDFNQPVCTVCRESLCISSNGNVYPCSGWKGYLLGNVNKQGLKDIWNHSKKAEYLRNLTLKDFPKCFQCPDRKYCNICLVKNANENSEGDPLKINRYFCESTHLVRKSYEGYRK